ncbi:hypothetical protein [Streptomyces sp. NPDC090025]|uniref:hypothetical protein n=1 Tax=Streptomyces sp. NPDC090025 TaxID=3365922 RepID=UPI00383841E7
MSTTRSWPLPARQRGQLVLIQCRRATADPALLGLGLPPADAELLETGWSVVRTADVDVLRP